MKTRQLVYEGNAYTFVFRKGVTKKQARFWVNLDKAISSLEKLSKEPRGFYWQVKEEKNKEVNKMAEIKKHEQSAAFKLFRCTFVISILMALTALALELSLTLPQKLGAMAFIIGFISLIGIATYYKPAK